MYKYVKNFLLVLICVLAFQNKAQPMTGSALDDEYTIIIGNKRITPSKNVHAFSTLKKELSKNLYDDSYHVIIQFNDQPNIDLQSQMARNILNELTISENTYIAAVNSNTNKRILKQLNVRAILALSPEMKVAPILAQSREDIIKVNIVTPRSVSHDMITKELNKYDPVFKLNFMGSTVNKYTYLIDKSKLNLIAKLPWVLQIEEGGMK